MPRDEDYPEMRRLSAADREFERAVRAGNPSSVERATADLEAAKEAYVRAHERAGTRGVRQHWRDSPVYRRREGQRAERVYVGPTPVAFIETRQRRLRGENVMMTDAEGEELEARFDLNDRMRRDRGEPVGD